MTASLWSNGFRAFFWLGALNVVGSLATWVAYLSGVAVATQGWPPQHLHAHEMLHGTVVPAIAGFLLTAVPNWTGTEPLRGRPIVALVGLWLAGRIALVLGDVLASGVVLAIDGAFLPVLAVAVGRPILRARKPRNYAVPLILLGLAAANVAMHRGLASHDGLLIRTGAIASVHLVVCLLLLITGRIVPLFTRNALRRDGDERPVESDVRVGAAALSVSIAALALDLLSPGHVLGAWLMLAAGPLLIARQLSWRPAAALGRPILWVLHVGHAFIAVGFVCHGAALLFGAMPVSAALHAFTAGAMGCTILGMMTRVSLGHTGRPVEASALTAVAYACVIAAALVRVFGVALAPASTLLWYQLSGGAFSVGYLIFAVEFTPVLFRARVDA